MAFATRTVIVLMWLSFGRIASVVYAGKWQILGAPNDGFLLYKYIENTLKAILSTFRSLEYIAF